MHPGVAVTVNSVRPGIKENYPMQGNPALNKLFLATHAALEWVASIHVVKATGEW